MAKLTCALLVLALIATPFLSAMEASTAGRSVPGGKKDVNDRDKLYGGSKFCWVGLVGPWGIGLLHPWLWGPPPFWWLKNGKTTNPNNPIASSSAYNNGHDTTSEVANFATTSQSP